MIQSGARRQLRAGECATLHTAQHAPCTPHPSSPNPGSRSPQLADERYHGHSPHRHLELLGVNSARAVGVKQVEGLPDLLLLLLGQARPLSLLRPLGSHDALAIALLVAVAVLVRKEGVRVSERDRGKLFNSEHSLSPHQPSRWILAKRTLCTHIGYLRPWERRKGGCPSVLQRALTSCAPKSPRSLPTPDERACISPTLTMMTWVLLPCVIDGGRAVLWCAWVEGRRLCQGHRSDGCCDLWASVVWQEDN